MVTFKELAVTSLVALSLVAPSSAFWRMPCRRFTGRQRIDPIVNKGVPAPHLHAITGGNNFGFYTEYEDLRSSNCTSCAVIQDKSAYWTPSLLFMYADGTTVPVDDFGGVLVYYLLHGKKIKAFPAGFKMLSGDTNQRTFDFPFPDPPKSEWSGDQLTQFALGQKALGFNCLNYATEPEATLFRHTMPDKSYLDRTCKDGLRVELAFPSCWNGKDLDSSNHRDHVAYSNLVLDGECPPDFPVRLPTLLFEMIYNVAPFKGEAGEFIFSNGDKTGCGFHGDFLNGWEEDFLQQAVDTCTNPSGNVQDCPLFELQSDEECAKCKFSVPDELKDDNCDERRPGICGDVNEKEATKPVDLPPAMPKEAAEAAQTVGYNEPEELVSIKVEETVEEVEVAAITPAPTAPPSVNGNACASVVTSTNGGTVSEICVIQKIVYETVTIGNAKQRRHLHHHNHRLHGGA